MEVEGTWVIQLSELIDPGPLTDAALAPVGSSSWLGLDRLLARELAMSLAQRAQIRARKEVVTDTLRQGLTLHALSPRDLALIAELELLAHAAATHAPSAAAARREVLAIIDYGGLRETVDGWEARRALVQQVASARTIALIRALGGDNAALEPGDAEALRELRVVAAADLEDHVARAFYERAAFPMPSAAGCGLHAGDRLSSEAIQLAVRAERAHEGAARLPSELRTPWRDPMIGGGAALAARAPTSVLVDGRGRWRRDPSYLIAQTARELLDVRHAGVGDPLELAAADQRVPVAALRFWQDSIAALGPVVVGQATVRRAGATDQLWLDIRAEAPARVHSIELEGIPIIATGFPPERIIGLPSAPRGELVPATLPGVLEELLTLLSTIAAPDAVRAHRALRARVCASWEDATAVLAELPAGLAGALRLAVRGRYLLEFLEVARGWSQLRSAHPGMLLLADEVNDRTFVASYGARAGSRWLIAGLSGTGLSAAEVIFQQDPTASVVMIGPQFTDGLKENGQLRALAAAHGLRFPRLENHRVIRLEHDGHRFRVTSLVDRNEVPHEGDRVVVALGRAGRIPSPIETLVLAAKREGRTPQFLPLRDLEGHYLGYEVIVFNRRFHVIGAASRLLPRDMMRTRDADHLQEVVEIADDCDAPPESGGFAGGFASSSTQAARYSRWRRAGMPSP